MKACQVRLTRHDPQPKEASIPAATPRYRLIRGAGASKEFWNQACPSRFPKVRSRRACHGGSNYRRGSA